MLQSQQVLTNDSQWALNLFAQLESFIKDLSGLQAQIDQIKIVFANW